MARKFYKKNWKKKTLKKNNIFGKQSAKSQAKQIYALNKKVNYIQKTTAPETKTFNNVLFYFDSYEGGTGRLLPEYHRVIGLYRDRILNQSLKRYLDVDGDLLRVKNIYLYGYFGLKDYTFYSSDDQEYNIPKDAYLKVTVARAVKGTCDVPTRLYQPLPNISPSGINAEYNEGVPISYINGPMVDGITSQLQILKKKVIHITPAKTSKMMKIKLYNSKKCNLNYRIGSSLQDDRQGEILIYVDYISPVSLYRTSVTPNEMVAPRVVAQFNYKLVYSDDGTKEVSSI